MDSRNEGRLLRCFKPKGEGTTGLSSCTVTGNTRTSLKPSTLVHTCSNFQLVLFLEQKKKNILGCAMHGFCLSRILIQAVAGLWNPTYLLVHVRHRNFPLGWDACMITETTLRKRCVVTDSTDRHFCEVTTGPHPTTTYSLHSLAGSLFL